MLKIYSGDRNKILAELKSFNVPIRYSSDASKERGFGLFSNNGITYFLLANTSMDTLKRLNTSKNKYVCIVDKLDKRSAFYKKYNKRIIYLAEDKKETDIVTEFYKDFKTIGKVSDGINFLYQLFYRKDYSDKMLAGFCINLVLTGKLKAEMALPLFLSLRLDKTN